MTPTLRHTDTPTQVVLGVDPGLATTGWGVVEKNGAELILRCFGAIVTRPDLSLPQRLHQIQRELAQIIRESRPQVVAIEELYFAKFAVSIAATAQARGVILWTAQEHGVPVVEYNPRAVKLALTGFGSASKIQMQTMVQRMFRLKTLPRPDDAADALAIAMCHLQSNPLLMARKRGSEEARSLIPSEPPCLLTSSPPRVVS